MASKAFKNLVAALETGYLESKKQQDHFFKVLNGRNEEAKEIVRTAFLKHGEIKLSYEQQKQGYKWLLNLWLTPSSKERKNNPFNYRQQNIIDNFDYVTLVGWHCPVASYFAYYYPIYCVYDAEDDYFEYTCIGGNIKIVG